MKKGILVGLVVCIVAEGLLPLLGGGGEERTIERRLDALVELVEKDGPVSMFESISRARKLVDFSRLTPPLNTILEHYPPTLTGPSFWPLDISLACWHHAYNG